MIVQGEENAANACNITLEWINCQGARFQGFLKTLKDPTIGISNILRI
jgi:hypothetical protein